MDLLGTLLNGMTSQSSLDSLSKKAKANTDQVSDLLSSALPLMMGKVSSNASTKEGAASLIGALSQHTSTASLEEQIKDADDEDGKKIIGHIFGADLDSMLSDLSGQCGLTVSQVNSVLDSVAPAVMSSLSGSLSNAAGKKGGRIDLSDGIDMKDVTGLLGIALGGLGDSKKSDPGLGSVLGAIGSILKK